MVGFTYKFGCRRLLSAFAGLLIAAGGWLACPLLYASPPVLSIGPIAATNASTLQITVKGDTNYSYVVQASTDLQNWTPVLTNRTIGSNVTMNCVVGATNNFSFYRAVAVGPAFTPYFGMALVAKGPITLIGPNLFIDSFNSTNAYYSTGGLYDPTKREANAIVATLSSARPAVYLSNAIICGSVNTGLSGIAFLSANSSIGDLAWNAVNSGIEVGHASANFSGAIPDVSAPNTTGWSTSLPVSNGTNVLNGGSYAVASVQRNLLITAPSVLWVQGSLSTGVSISPGGSLILYVGTSGGSGDSLSLSGNNGINHSGVAADLQMYGLPSLTSISMSGNASWIGTIYAPEADFSGGGTNAQDCSGAIVVNSLTATNQWHFHYDESLKSSGIGY